MYCTPRYDAVPMIRRLTNVAKATYSRVRRTTGKRRSIAGKTGGSSPVPSKTAPLEPDTNWNQQQTEDENGRENQIDENANIGMWWSR